MINDFKNTREALNELLENTYAVSPCGPTPHHQSVGPLGPTRYSLNQYRPVGAAHRLISVGPSGPTRHHSFH